MKKGTTPKYQIIDDQEDPETYRLLGELLDRHYGDLRPASIVLAYCNTWRPDADGRMTLGKCVRAPEIWQRISGVDFVILLNGRVFKDLKPPQQKALIDHELCHAAPALDEQGDQKETPDGFKRWRVVKHDLEEFRAIVARHGFWKGDLQLFAREVLRASDMPLFADQLAPDEEHGRLRIVKSSRPKG